MHLKIKGERTERHYCRLSFPGARECVVCTMSFPSTRHLVQPSNTNYFFVVVVGCLFCLFFHSLHFYTVSFRANNQLGDKIHAWINDTLQVIDISFLLFKIPKKEISCLNVFVTDWICAYVYHNNTGWAQGASGGDGGQSASTRSQLGRNGFRDGRITWRIIYRKCSSNVISLPNDCWRRWWNASAFFRRRRHFGYRPSSSTTLVAGNAFHGRSKWFSQGTHFNLKLKMCQKINSNVLTGERHIDRNLPSNRNGWKRSQRRDNGRRFGGRRKARWNVGPRSRSASNGSNGIGSRSFLPHRPSKLTSLF